MSIRALFQLPFVALLITAVPGFAQLGPLNWNEPMKVEANNVFLLWHDNPNVGGQTHQKTYGFDFLGDSLPPASRVSATPRQEDGQTGVAAFTDVANGKFTVDARENVVCIWGPGASGINIMLPLFDTTAAAWTTTVQDSIEGDIQDANVYVPTIDLDGDSLDEFVVAYLDNSDSIHFNLYDVDSLLHTSLIASYSDRRIIPNPSNFMTTYCIETGDFNDDGTEELALLRIASTSGDIEVEVQIYSFNGTTLVTAAMESLYHQYSGSLAALEFVMDAAGGNYVPGVAKELAVTTIQGSGSLPEAKSYMLEVSADLASISYGSGLVTTLPSGNFHLSMGAGDLVDDELDEMVFAAGRNVFIITTGDTLALGSIFAAYPFGTVIGDYAYSMNNFMRVTDVDQDGREEIVTVYDPLVDGNAGFHAKVFAIDSLGAPTLVGERNYDEDQPIPGTSPPEHEYRPYSIAVGDYDGLNFTIGQPSHYVAQDMVHPIVMLNAPPVHFDRLDSVLYDLNECYNGSACDFGATYRKQTTTSVEVSTTVRSDWVTSDGLSLTGATSWGATVEAAPLGVGATASLGISYNWDFHVLKNWGEHFDSTSTSSTTLTIGVEVTAKEDDRIYSTVTEYDVWEYPVFHGNEPFPRGTILTAVPLNVQATWFPSKSYNAVNYVPDHEVAHVLSYPAYADLEQNPNLDQAIAADYNNDSFVLDASSDYDWFLTMNDFQSTSADTTIESGWDIGISTGLFRHDGDFGDKTMETHRTSVTDLIDLNVHLGSVDMGIGDAKYTVTPYAYWDKSGALVIDYAAKPEVAPPGFPETWWQTQYGQLSDPAFILPWRLDPEKGFAISEEAKREQTKDIIFSPAAPIEGDTLTITARVRNFSLLPTPLPVSVSFYIGDPDAGGVPLVGLSGTNTVMTMAPIPAQVREDVSLEWVVPSTLPAFPRIYAVLDEGDLIEEIHEDHNKGFNVLGFDSDAVGVQDDPTMNNDQASLLCYPNPFNATTTIRYTVPQDDHVTITVFDQVGRNVATLVDERQPAGTRSITFNASGSAPGIYYCSLRTGASHQARKMVLMDR